MKRKLLMGAVLVSIIAAIAFFGAKDNIKIFLIQRIILAQFGCLKEKIEDVCLS